MEVIKEGHAEDPAEIDEHDTSAEPQDLNNDGDWEEEEEVWYHGVELRKPGTCVQTIGGLSLTSGCMTHDSVAASDPYGRCIAEKWMDTESYLAIAKVWNSSVDLLGDPSAPIAHIGKWLQQPDGVLVHRPVEGVPTTVGGFWKLIFPSRLHTITMLAKHYNRDLWTNGWNHPEGRTYKDIETAVKENQAVCLQDLAKHWGLTWYGLPDFNNYKKYSDPTYLAERAREKQKTRCEPLPEEKQKTCCEPIQEEKEPEVQEKKATKAKLDVKVAENTEAGIRLIHGPDGTTRIIVLNLNPRKVELMFDARVTLMDE